VASMRNVDNTGRMATEGQQKTVLIPSACQALKIIENIGKNRQNQCRPDLQKDALEIEIRAWTISNYRHQMLGLWSCTKEQLRHGGMILKFCVQSKQGLHDSHVPVIVPLTTPRRNVWSFPVPIQRQTRKRQFASHQPVMEIPIVGGNPGIDTHKKKRSGSSSANGGRKFKIGRIARRAFKSKRQATSAGVNYAEKVFVQIHRRHSAE